MVRWRSRRTLFLVLLILLLGIFVPTGFAGGAGLYWGPIDVAGVRVYMTNPHEGYAGPKVGYATHVNLHVEYTKSGSYADLANLHVTRYTSGGKMCMYVWDRIPSRTGVVVYDQCKDDWNSVTSAAAEQARTYVNSLGKVTLPVVQYVALIGIMMLAIVALLALLSALPILVLAADMPEAVLGAVVGLWSSLPHL